MSVALLDRPDRVRAALSPLRRRLLERLREPASATSIAAELSLPRQRVNYHLRELERAGLVQLVEERQRRGCTERILAARAAAFIVDPAVIGARTARAIAVSRQDRFSAEHLIDAASSVVRHVARMRGQAEQQGTRLLTFTADTDIAFATPADFDRFTTELAAFLARQASQFHVPRGGRHYRVLLAAHPAPSGGPHGRPRTRRDSRRRSH
jgi:DNA-binding transcriptional ArsR family regulator